MGWWVPLWIWLSNFISPRYVRLVRIFLRPLIERVKFLAREFREYFLARNVLKREWTLEASSFGNRLPFLAS